MANAKKTTHTVFDLTLSEEETLTLIAILRNIVGDPDTTRRKHTAATLQALMDAGADFDAARSVQNELTGSIVFAFANPDDL